MCLTTIEMTHKKTRANTHQFIFAYIEFDYTIFIYTMHTFRIRIKYTRSCEVIPKLSAYQMCWNNTRKKNDFEFNFRIWRSSWLAGIRFLGACSTAEETALWSEWYIAARTVQTTVINIHITLQQKENQCEKEKTIKNHQKCHIAKFVQCSFRSICFEILIRTNQLMSRFDLLHLEF